MKPKYIAGIGMLVLMVLGFLPGRWVLITIAVVTAALVAIVLTILKKGYGVQETTVLSDVVNDEGFTYHVIDSEHVIVNLNGTQAGAFALQEIVDGMERNVPGTPDYEFTNRILGEAMQAINDYNAKSPVECLRL